jgi:hypothetical protein
MQAPAKAASALAEHPKQSTWRAIPPANTHFIPTATKTEALWWQFTVDPFFPWTLTLNTWQFLSNGYSVSAYSWFGEVLSRRGPVPSPSN